MNLTERQRQVILGLAAGKTVVQVAKELGISDPTVYNTAVAPLYSMLDAKTHPQIVARAYEQGILRRSAMGSELFDSDRCRVVHALEDIAAKALAEAGSLRNPNGAARVPEAAIR